MHHRRFHYLTGSVLPLLAGIALAMPGAAAAEPSAPDPAAAALAQLRAADSARSDLAREEAAWALERARLAALIDATAADTARLERDAAEAEARRDDARARLAALGQGSDLDALRDQLATSGTQAAAALAAIARTVPPGTVPTPDAATGDGAYDAAVRALDRAERAAGEVAVEVVTGEREGKPQAVKMLRVAGAAAWWVALDGTDAGTVRVVDGTARLTALGPAEAQAVRAAVAQFEGRQPPGVVVLAAPAGAAP